MKIQYIVHCWLNVENSILGVSRQKFTRQVRSKQWTKTRLGLFNKYTLPSLLNQTFKDFRIFLFCGERYRAITDNYKFDDPDNRLELIYDCGKKAYSEIDSERVSIMRIDSDDMFHREMMADVKRLAEEGNKQFCIKWMLQWNVLHNFVSNIKIINTPYTNHVFPKAVYKDFSLLAKRQFTGYRHSPELIPNDRACIIRHKDNVTWTRIRKNPASASYKNEEKRKRNKFITNPKRVREILEDYGVRT